MVLETDFLCNGNHFLWRAFLVLRKTAAEPSGNEFLKQKFDLATRNLFLFKTFFLLMDTIIMFLGAKFWRENIFPACADQFMDSGNLSNASFLAGGNWS